MTNVGMIEQLLERLESVTTRLEKVESAVIGGTAPPAPRTVGGGASLGSSLVSPSSGSGVSSSASQSVAAYDALLQGAVADFVNAASDATLKDTHAAKAAAVLKEAFDALKPVLVAIASCKKPANPGDIQSHLQPVASALEAANKLTMGKRTDYDHHVRAVSEFLNALQFVCFVEKGQGLSLPAPHVEESWQSAEFYGNKVLVQKRNSGPSGEPHVAYIKKLKEVSTALRDYVKAHHTTGPAWNPSGGDLKTFKAGGGGAAAAAKSIPAPPPPPPPGFFDEPRAAPAAGGGMSALMGELNQGSGVTTGLKKVTDDMKTKNRTDKSGAVPGGSAKPQQTTAAPAAAAKKMPPKMALEGGRKWVVEHQVNATDLVIDKCDMRQTVYLYKCEGSVLQIKGKVNGICMDQCKKTAIVFQDAVAQCEVVNCTSVQIQVDGSVPTIQVDKTDGVQIYLMGEKSNDVSILTAKSSEMNVLTKPANPDDDMLESPLPEQYESKFDAKSGKWTTVAVAHSG